MNVEFFYNKYPPNKVNKGIDKNNPVLHVENVRWKEENSLNILEPTIIFTPDVTQNVSWRDIVDSAKFNYFYIPKFTRFYFITNISTENGRIVIKGKVDALSSFMDDVYNSTQFIVRQQSKRTSMLPDSHYPIRADHKYLVKNFTRDVYDPSCSNVILITTGKGGTPVAPQT